jgi:DNA replication protein DnaC
MSFEELSKHMPIKNQRFENFDLSFYPDKSDKNGVVPRKIMTSVLKMTKEYAINFTPTSKSLLFIGGVGLGKTHLSLSIVSEVLAKGYDVVYGSAQNLFSAAEREHFSYTGESAKTDALLQCDLLVIDDLGTEFMTSFTQSLFYNIINTRLLSCKPTIINTNLNFKELEERYTPRITSRFMGEYELIKFFGIDIRQQKMLAK